MKRSRITALVGLTAAAGLFAGAAYFYGGSADADPNATEPEPIAQELCVRKMALDLTNRGPTAEELSRVASGETTLDALADEYMATSEFSDIVYNWYKGKFPPTMISPEGTDVEEPVRIAHRIVMEERDYREILTGGWTIRAGGRIVNVTDRPAAGVLSTQHYMSAYSGSFRRNWAGHFLGEWGNVRLEAVSLPPDLDEADLAPGSLLENPACNGCHGDEVWGVDLLASFAQCYADDGSYRGGDCTGTWLTQEGTDLADLGRITAESKRFKAHTVNYFVTKLFGRHLAAEETDFYLAATVALDTTDFNAKALLRHIVTSPEYCSQ